jgi:BirA family biotin operon repressor/biotin-[acetyl-CoA-carboxylase] ligase
MKAIKTTEKVLNLLIDGEFHSGEQIGAALGITRSAIWKAIQDLSKKYQLDVESVAGKGYRLPQKIELLDPALISAELNTEDTVDNILVLDQIESTNDYLLSQIKSGNTAKIACFAEQQTQGKGRRGRTWISPFGHNIYHSLLCSFSKDTSEIMGLGLAIAVAVLEALREYGIEKGLALKWPNDIYHEGKKLAGILLEMSAQANDACQVVIGVGINTHLNPAEARVIDQPFTSLSAIEKQSVRRNQLAGILLKHLIHAIKLFEKEGLSPFLIRWDPYDFLKNREIHLIMSTKNITGIMRGISERGALLLEVDGEIQPFFSGDTSVRPGAPA